MKLDPKEVLDIKNEFGEKPELGEVVPHNETASQQKEMQLASPKMAPYKQTNSPVTIDHDTGEAVIESGDATVDAVGTLMKQQSQASAALLVALDKINKGNAQINMTLDRIFGLMYDERYAPQVDVWKRPPPIDNKSREMEPGDGTGEGMLDNLLGGALGALAGLLAGKSVLGSVFGRNKGADNKPTKAKPKGKPSLMERIKGKIGGAGAPNPSTVKTETPDAAKKAKTPPSDGPDNPNKPKPSTVDAKTKTAPKLKGRMALLAAGGAAAYAGYEYAADAIKGVVSPGPNKDPNKVRTVSMAERQMQQSRVSQGLEPLQGDDLIAYRSAQTESNGMIANTYTGDPLTEIQSQAVRANVLTPRQASGMTNDQVYESLKAAGVPTDYRPSQGLFGGEAANDSGVMQYADEVAVAGVGMYAAKRVGDLMSSSSTVPDSPTQPATAPKPTSSAPSLLQRPKPESAIKPNMPSDAQLKAIKNTIKTTSGSVVPSAADYAEAAKANTKGGGGGMLKGGMGKALPVIGTALTAYDAAQIITDKEATTAQKAGSLADLAGGTAGAILGAKGGATAGAAVGAGIGSFFFGAGAVPGAAIGAAIGGIGGGIAGYLGGSGITKSVREWMFGDDINPADMAGPSTATAAGPNSQVIAVDQTEKAFDTIVSSSKPQNNPWVSSVMGGNTPAPKTGTAGTNQVGIGVLKPQTNTANQPAAVSNIAPTTTSVAAPNVASANQPVSAPASIANVRTQVQNPEPIVREQYNPVKETVVVNQPKDREQVTQKAKEAAGESRFASNGNTAAPVIDEISPVVNDAGLGFLNTGIM